MNLNRLLGLEIDIVHVGHFLLFIGAPIILAPNVPGCAVLVAAPLMILGILGWLHEACLDLPAAPRLLSPPTAEANADQSKPKD